ncbi:WD repeat-containing protein [Ceratobasidium sp. AG-Ba]|nr:WD repeat-containing protein [Ceratobasidium sp. AG-Ba]QRW12018.1 WD repeat-containing protein [Ceratobasidium sp. AG-Ba]
MLATSPKRSSATAKKREAPNGVDAPQKKRRKDKTTHIAPERHWAWASIAESSISSLAPLFTPDSRYFFTTAASSLQIFSSATGKLISTIPAHDDTITALALHPLNPSHLFSASLDGTLKRWDTHHGALLETLRVDQPVTHIAVHPELGDEVFVATGAKSGKNSDSSHIFRITTRPASQLPSPQTCLSQPPKPRKSSRTVYIGKTRRAAGLAVSSCAKYLIVVGGTKAYVARLGIEGFTSFVSPDALTCLAVHPTESYFATGDERGVVRLWYCLNEQALSTLSTSSKPANPSSSKSKSSDLSSTASTTTLHWHAHAVSALSFTPSGAQLLSGGEESVLVVWQLHSGRRDYIPRVGAPIGGVAVCSGPNGGSEYAIALVDGGIVFVGSDTLRIGRAVRRVRLDSQPTRPLPLAIHPRTNHILLPAAHPSSLQILARNSALVGEIQVAPANRVSRRDEAPIEPVRVTLVAINGGREGKGKAAIDESGASEGEWMATVDSRPEGEVYLKFWRWNGDSTNSNPCTLNTRIDRPHGDDKVTGLSFSPSLTSPTLATTGTDGSIKLWSIHNASDQYWLCIASLTYRSHIPFKTVFSCDGSLLAVVHDSCITLWAVEGQKMCGALTCVEVKEPRDVVFIGKSGRYITVLGERAVVVWDLVRFSVLWHAPLDYPSSSAHIVSHPINPTFALLQHPTPTSTQISLFSPTSSTPIETHTLGFKFVEPLWSDLGVVGLRENDQDGRWSLVLAGDDVKSIQSSSGGIDVDDMPVVPRTLFEDIFGRGSVGTGLLQNGADKGKAKEIVSQGVRMAKRKARKTERKAGKGISDLKPAAEIESESEEESATPESSEPATEGDAELEAIPFDDISEMKRKSAFLDGTIQVTKKVNGVVGVHSASDDEEDDEEVL